MVTLRNLCGLLLLAVQCMAQNAPYANTGDQTDRADPVLEALTAEAARKKKKAEIAESEKKIREAQPGDDVKVLEGETTIDDSVKIESEMFSYNAVQEISKEIATRVNNCVAGNGNHEAATIYIYDTSLPTALRAYQAFLIQEQAIQRELKLLEKDFNALDNKDPQMATRAFRSAAGAARSVINLLSLFRQDTDFKGRSVTVDEEALVAQVAYEINRVNKKAMVVYPKLFPPDLSIVPNPDKSKLIKSIETLQHIQATAAKRVRQLEKRAEGNTTKHRENLKQAFSALNEHVASLLGILLKTEQNAGSTLLGTLLTAENIRGKLKQEKNGYLLALKSVAAGGNYRTRRNLFTTLFTGARLSYSGGAIVSFILLDRDSRIVTSRTLQYMNGFSKFKNLKKLTNGHNFDD